FFFSSRRRHTSFSRDWSSDVCSSDLRRFPNLVVPPSDDLCFATKNRQDAVRQIAARVDLFLVVTSAASSNGMRLVELAQDITGKIGRASCRETGMHTLCRKSRSESM